MRHLQQPYRWILQPILPSKLQADHLQGLPVPHYQRMGRRQPLRSLYFILYGVRCWQKSHTLPTVVG